MAIMDSRETQAADSLQRTGEAHSAAIHTITGVALWTARGTAVLLLALGVLIWIGGSDGLVPIHAVIGVVLVMSLWTIATIAARSGVSGRAVGVAVGWSMFSALLGLTQQDLLAGGWHWTIQTLHTLISIGIVAWCQYLVILMRRASV